MLCAGCSVQVKYQISKGIYILLNIFSLTMVDFQCFVQSLEGAILSDMFLYPRLGQNTNFQNCVFSGSKIGTDFRSSSSKFLSFLGGEDLT